MGDKALRYLALAQVPAGGLVAVQQGRTKDTMIDEAVSQLESLNTDEASQIATMVRDNPMAADSYVKKLYGGWEKMYAGLQSRAMLEDASEATREALAGSPPATPEENTRREIYLRNLNLGREVSPATLNSLAPPRTATPAMLGLQADDWTGDSMNEVMKTYRQTGVPDYTLLQSRGKRTEKIPSGYYKDENTGDILPIPGTKAEMDSIYNRILRRAATEVADKSNNITDFDSFLEAHPDVKAWVTGYWKKSQDPMVRALAGYVEAQEKRLKGESAGKQQPSAETRSALEDILGGAD